MNLAVACTYAYTDCFRYERFRMPNSSKQEERIERIWYVCDYVNFRLNVNLFTYHAGENVLHLWCSST